VPTADQATGEMVGRARQFGLSITIPFSLAIEPAGQSGADFRERVRRTRFRELGNPAAGEQDPN
jgi:hypothetical protein